MYQNYYSYCNNNIVVHIQLRVYMHAEMYNYNEASPQVSPVNLKF